jgi:hypothetical protein
MTKVYSKMRLPKMPKWEEMMLLPVEKRRKHFKDCYALELGRLHATGKCRWPIERLPSMVELVMDNLGKREAPQGPAFEAVKKFFGLKTQKQTFEFLGY